MTSVSGLTGLVNCDTGAAIDNAALGQLLGLPLTITAGQPGTVSSPLVGCWNVGCPGGNLSVSVTAVAEHKDWCSIRRGHAEMERRKAESQ